MRRYALFFIAIAVLCIGAAPHQTFGEETLRLVEDPVAGVRIGIPSDFPLEGKPSKWGRRWSSHDGAIAVNTLVFAPGRTINDIYERLTAIKGRVLAGSPRLSGSAFVLEGRDADGMAFFIAARQDGTVVRGVSIIYPDARKRESAEFVRRIAQSFALLSVAGEAAGQPVGKVGISKPSPPPTDCAAETANLERVARGVAVTVSPPGGLSVGEKIAVRWQAESRFPAGLPVYLIFTMPEEVRIETVVVSGQVDEKTGETQSALKGYIALPPTARAPQDIAFGAGGARLFAPFHQPGSGASGAYNILPYRAGPWPMEYAVVARTSCGERLLTPARKQTFAVNLGAPKVVIQDPFPLDTPDQVILSNSGAYSLQVFKDRYRVFDAVTGALIVERAGSAPNFSPTSRYLTAASGGANARGFKQHDAVDLVTGEVIAQTSGVMIGWSNGDAFFVDANQDWGLASAYQALVTDAASTERQPLWIADSPMSCHACVSSSEAILDIDIDNGIIVFFNAQALDSGGAVLCELSGGKCSAGSSRSELEETIRKDYALVPFSLPELKKSWASLAYSHIDEGGPASGFKVARHKQQSAGRLPLSQPGLRIVKAGDWRSTVRPRSVALGRVGGKGYFDQLGEFGIAVAGLSELTVRWPTPEWARAEKAGIDRYDEPGRALYAREFAKLESGLLADFPDMNSLIGPGSDFPYEGKLAADQKIDLKSHLLGAWSLISQGEPVWLVQIHTVEGSGGFGHGALFLLDGRRDKAGRLIGAEKGLTGIIPAGDVDQIQFQMRIADGRYLLYSALVNKEIRLYDIERQTELSRIPVHTDSDLQIDLRVTKDLRHVLQVNSDGQFFLYETATARRLLSGWFVDDEMLVYTQDGYFRSSYEGAALLHVKFPGMRGLHSFQQFASQLDNPRIIKDLLAGQGAAPAKPVLTPPPRLAIELAPADGKHPARLIATASATGEMRSLRLFADGQPLKTIELKGASIKDDIPLSDAAGARLLTVLAVDDRGLISQPQSVNLAAPGRPNATLFGVFVGVNRYADPRVPQLAQAVSDATNAEAAFKLAATRTYARVKTSLLTDERASPSSLKSTIEAIAAEAGIEDTFVLFFAGHGLQSRDGKFYLTSTGFKISDPAGTGMSWSDLAKALSKVKARVVLFIDACHSGSIGAQLATNDGAVTDLLQGSGRPLLVFAAAKGRQFSYENANIKGGYFTHFLCRILTKDRARYDLNKNGILEISELYLALKEEVSRKVWDDERGAQTLWLARRDMIGDFGLF